MNSEFNKASSTLIETVQNEIDPVGYSGKGYGIAPIGHIVTVDTVNEVTINISTSLTFDEGYAWNNVQEEVTAAIERISS